MERETWMEMSEAIAQVDRRWRESRRYTHRTATIVKVHLWAVRHDRPTSWACDRANWDARSRPIRLPDQSTMSRRTRGKPFQRFMVLLGKRLAGKAATACVKWMDGKALAVAAHSTDRDARWGRGAGQLSKGYKLHLIGSSGRTMPWQWALTPLDVDERVVARRLVKRLGGWGYVLCDASYDDNPLHEVGRSVEHQVVAPRRRPGTGLGHRTHSSHRIRCIEMLESPGGVSDFGNRLHRRRGQVERDFGNLVSYGGGLNGLPSWVRRIWRVRAWVHGKLLLNAARIRCRRRLRA